jgi:hypothetical protein
VRSLVVISKTTSPTKRGGAPAQPATSHYLSSLPPQRAERFAKLARGHWGGCEIRNHWTRDVLFEEDATRSRNLNLNGNLAVLRCALIALKARLAPKLSWPQVFELSSMKTSIPFNMICHNSFK